MTNRTFLLLILSVFILTSGLLAKNTGKKSAAAAPEDVIAVRISEPIKIDGVLNESLWQGEGVQRFTQIDPNDGTTPSEKTSVWVAYDEKALYVAARLFDSQPHLIKRRLGRRDDYVDSDWFTFAVDPYNDKRSGYRFSVNPAGCIIDATLFNDIENDETWDGIWDYAVSTDDQGWSLEIKIPFNQLRFKKRDEYTWGVNFGRLILRKNERLIYAWVPKEEVGYVSRFATLKGIRQINPGRNIEVLPYTVGSAQFSPKQEGNPFQTGRDWLGNVGLDLKVSLKSNLTLDATINPDFGQVEVDPAVVNLSAYETFFQEKRPFFIEGNNLFNAFGRGGVAFNVNISFPEPTMFYSRRIGRPPQGYVTMNGYRNVPDRSTILGAVKLSGKIANGWNLGFINALTSREFAEIDSGGHRFQEEVEPFSYYGVLRAQRDFNEGRQGLGFLVTSVHRNLGNENLTSLLSNNASTLGIDGYTFLDKDKTWVFSGWAGATYINGSQDAIHRLQHSSIHYFQRPDASHVNVDKGATHLSGWGGRIQLNKQRGRLIINSAIGVLSPGFNPNDMGFQGGQSDIINGSLLFGYIFPHPNKITRSSVLALGAFRNYNFGGDKIWDGILALAQGDLLNYWGFNVMLAFNPQTVSHSLTRGGPLARIPYGYQVNTTLNTDNRKRLVFSLNSSLYRRPTFGSMNWNGGFSISWKPSSNFSFSLGPGYFVQKSDYQWIRRVDDPIKTDTFGTRYVFGKIFQQVISASLRINWIFTPKLSLQAYLQPYLAVGQYSRFKEMARPDSMEYNVFGENGSNVTFKDDTYTVDPDGAGPAGAFSFYNPDFNFKSLRGTVVLRWEYHPGSILYFVWTQNRRDFANPGNLNIMRDLGDLFTAPGDNIFLIKFSYRFNI